MSGYTTTTQGTSSGAYPYQTGQTAATGYVDAESMYQNTPFAQYPGQLTAGNNQTQLGAANSLVPQTGYQAPNVTAGGITGYTGGTGAGGLSIGGQDLSGYMNPYTQQVINTTMTGLNNQLAATNQASDANATQAGAFGGDRAAIVNAQNAYNTNQIAAQTIAGLNQSNFSNAQTQAQTDLNRQLQAGTTQSQLGLQADQGNQFADIQGANIRDSAANSLYQIGTQQQQTQQAGDTAGYNNFQLAQQWPIALQQDAAQATAQYAPALAYNGTTSQSGSQTTPGPSTLSQVLGGVTAATGLAGLLSGSGSSSGGGLIGSIGSLFGSGSSSTGDAASAATADNAAYTAATSSEANSTDDLGNLFYGPGFAAGGTVSLQGGLAGGYADGGDVDRDDGTFLPADDDDAEVPKGLLADVLPDITAGGSTGGTVVPNGSGDGLAGMMADASSGASSVVGSNGVDQLLVPAPGSQAQASQWLRGASPSVGARNAEPNNGSSTVSLGDDLQPATPGAPLGAAPAAGGLASMVPSASATAPSDSGAGGLAGAAMPPDGIGYDGQPLPVPPIPPATPPADPTAGAPPPASSMAGATAPADPAAQPRVVQSANPSQPLPGPASGASAPAAGSGLAGAVGQPRPGTPGAPGMQGGLAGNTGQQQPDFIDKLYARGGNSWALPVLAAGAAMMASRDPHPGVAIGQGLQAGLGEANDVFSGRQQSALKMLQMQQNNDYHMGMVQTSQQRAATGADRAQTYANISDARTQLALAQASVEKIKAAAPPRTSMADITNAAVQDLISRGMTPADAFAQVKNYTESNAIKQQNADTRADQGQQNLNLKSASQTALQANRDRIALQSATAEEGREAANLVNNGKAKDLTDALTQVRSAHATVGPAQSQVQQQQTSAPAYKQGDTVVTPSGQKLMLQGNQWLPTT